MGPGFAKHDLVLTDTTGRPYDLRQQTAGKATLVFFGCTNCPDVCPTTMGDIATALAQQPKAVRDSVEVVFAPLTPNATPPKAWGSG
ncbi:SCO family protein [Streptomyces albidochromogenes]|uniref:SCO family protein n=1 Tax=Streptomyces albidochromogenes TaxID=329524 RepID=A0ABW6FES4_9ACTN